MDLYEEIYDEYTLVREYRVEMEHCSVVELFEHSYSKDKDYRYLLVFCDYADVDNHITYKFKSEEDAEEYLDRLVDQGDMLSYKDITKK